jgi:Ca-activated chloride channel family protein
MIFLYDKYLFLLILVPVLGWWLGRYYIVRKANQAKFAEKPLIALISPTERKWVPYARTALILIAMTCLLLAIARPKGGEMQIEARSQGIDIYLLLDTSKSMVVEDVGMSRMNLQKAVAKAIIETHPNDRIGIIGFTGEPYVVCPLTLDHATLTTFLDNVNVDAGSSSPGTGYGDAIKLALTRFDKKADYGRAIVLFSDGENNKGTKPAKAARDALTAGVRVYPIGIGTTEGARLFELDFFRRPIAKTYNNEPVYVKLDKGTLNDVANISNGKAFFVENVADAQKVFLKFDRTSQAEFKAGLSTQKEDLAQWFLLIAALMMIADFVIDRLRLIPRKDPGKLWLLNGEGRKARVGGRSE